MKNKETVLKFYDRVFNGWDLSELDKMMREDYIQHSPKVEDGREGFRRFITDFLAKKPHADIIHILEDGDLVCVFFAVPWTGAWRSRCSTCTVWRTVCWPSTGTAP